MPITKSAQKALRQSEKRRKVNLRYKESFKVTVKEFKKLVAAGKFDDAKKLLPKVYKKLDKAAKKGVIKKNKSARLKSSAAHLLVTK